MYWDTLLVFLALSCWATWAIYKKRLSKLSIDNVPGPTSSSLLKDDLFNRHAWDFHDRSTEEYGHVFTFRGLLGTRGLYISDPLALTHVVLKDQAVYEEPGWFRDWNRMIFGPSILTTLGEQHRKQRKLVNPVFSSNHMRHMTPIFYDVVYRLRAAVLSEVEASAGEINIIEWMGRTALELIGQGGLGYSFDPLVACTKNEFGEAIKEFAPIVFALQFWRILSPYYTKYVPLVIRRLIVRWAPQRKVQRLRQIADDLERHSKEIFYSKKSALERKDAAVTHQVEDGQDLFSILVKANMTVSKEDRLSEEELIAQVSTFVFAATDTTSNALGRILHLLATHQDVQDKVRAEIAQAAPLVRERIPYDQLVGLPYLDAVVRETLRLYPPVTFMGRDVKGDVVLPLSAPIVGKDGSTMEEILVPNGTMVLIGIRACNRSKDIWGDDALDWKPERWLQPLPASVSNAHVPGVYSNLMTFLGGGRACIGFKFSQLEMKAVLAVMLCTFRFLPGKTEIYWNLAQVNYPTAGKRSTKPSLSLKLEVL
ncbi:hypothetical protein PHLGIDRAFT_116131 [Phlebiopsis gigantea 11061_1 CR5-6]|uniref:Cytochrome P450 n=1 Tax=Phlebiopsis gigantea (strain 11061_1 CR5-6) TaxID=745531 RepID=A0A0C3SDG0_PHLG1|nr:hypothetical protein PHLGIDRAFT_116131 [Phlebiopsis gigantea 11061_1 CR5-6]